MAACPAAVTAEEVGGGMSHRFEARWPIDPDADGMTFTALTREAKRDLPELLYQEGAELLCTPDGMDWRIEAGELVASGPARPWVDPKVAAALARQQVAA